MGTRVLLVDPPGDLSVPNLGIHTVAAAARGRGWDTEILRMTPQVGWEGLNRRIQDLQPRLLGVSVHCTTILGVLEWLAATRASRPVETTVIVGGPQSRWELRCAGFARQRGIIYQQAPAIDRWPMVNCSRDVVLVHPGAVDAPLTVRPSDLDDGIRPGYHLLTSNGCVNGCSFCNLPAFRWRPRPLDAVRLELRAARAELAFDEVTVWDPCLTENPSHALAVGQIIRQELGVPWRAHGCCLKDFETPRLVEGLAASGCTQVYFGVEGIADTALYPKGGVRMPLALAAATVARLRGAGIRCVGSFVCGLEGHTLDTVRASFAQARRLRLDEERWGHAIPLPGTRLRRHVLRNGRILRDYREVTFQQPAVSFETDEFPAEERRVAMTEIRSALGQFRR